MKTVKIKKGWPFKKIAGKPSLRVESRPAKKHVAFLPDKLPFVKPRLLVAKGDKVKIGSVLFEDKKNTDFKFLSPGSGEIADITYGPRRVIEEIIIALDADESAESFKTYTASDIEKLDRNTAISEMMAGGMWSFVRQLPFRAIAEPDSKPNAIWVTMGSADPFQPSPGLYLKDQTGFFEFGIHVLRRLADTVNICWYEDRSAKNDSPAKADQTIAHQMATHRIRGKYPASDAGVVLFHTKKSAEENRDWYLDGQDVVLIGKFFKNGIFPIDRIVAFSDGSPENSCHIKTRTGIRLNDLAAHEIGISNPRWVVGGVFCGYTGSGKGFLGQHETSVMIIEESEESEFFGFARPGFKKLSNSRTVASAMLPGPLSIDADMHGEERPCVNCGYCANICPVDIMPQYTYKSIFADEVEEALGHGLLDCVECGLCSFVCPSKIELTDTLVEAKHLYLKELNQVA